ncbi:DNA-binding response regulator [Salipaludibacillus neizhouensis]|uniref:DNA-binding response regulator n=1 Tax=Salipaludibacillus neizhouensis TaxID=885475 RepID=A0A3A9JZC8_9BACI|nr:response regulator transcription factor [Salipaludibacillus neizhouensis]RKL65539.1 DNA-binding response regulator [Salipaludibacillus neizhouensis]
MKNKILIVDDHLVVTEGLKLILETNESFEVIGEAQNGQEAIEFLDKQHPDVILLDLNMPVMSGLETIQQIKQRKIDIPIVILTTYNEDKLMVKGMKLGAKGYLLKDTNRDNLFRTIESAIRGETLIQSEIMAKILRANEEEGKIEDKGEKINHQLLTEKELFILRSVSKGYRNKEIACDLGIAERTVKAHLTNIYNKLGVDSRSEAVSVSIKRGYIIP